jgi:hypothetical protein
LVLAKQAAMFNNIHDDRKHKRGIHHIEEDDDKLDSHQTTKTSKIILETASQDDNKDIDEEDGESVNLTMLLLDSDIFLHNHLDQVL